MKRTLAASIAVAMIALGSASAFASDTRCNVPMAEWQPRENLQQKLKAEGWEVRRIKTGDGCYEVYAVDKSGSRIEAYFDPKTLEMLTLRKKSHD